MAGQLKDIHACFEEALRIAGFSEHGPVLIRPAQITMMVALLDATESGSYTYRIPNSSVFLIKEMRGHLSFNNWNGEVAVAAGLSTNATPKERAYLKALNAKIRLENVDRSQKITDENDLCLADILGCLGAAPIRWDELGPGFVVPSGQQLKMTATLSDSTAANTGASSDYGIVLSGVMLEVLGS